jgi:sugar-specific transcriptional regulator TrmB/predicted hydrocarbon binding protein
MTNSVATDIIARLVECGVEEKHAHIVMDLATHPPSKASEVGKRIGISRMDAYNSLRKMQDMGLIKATLDKPMRFMGIKIEEVFDLLIQKSEMDLRRIQEHLSAMKSDDHVALLSHDTGHDEANFTVLKDRHAIMANVQSMLSEAEDSVWMLLGHWGIFHLRRSGAFDALTEAVDRGIEVKISTSLNEKTVKFFDDLDTRIEIRHHEEFSMQGVYVDDEVGLQFINVETNPTGRGKNDTALLIESKEFMSAQVELMAIQWGAGTSFRAAKARLTEGKIIEPLNLSLGEGSYYERLRTSLGASMEQQIDAPNAFLRKAGDPMPSLDNAQADALSMLGVDLNDVLNGVGVRIGQELASKWNNVKDDKEFWKHLTNEWSQLGMGEIKTNGMPPESVVVRNGGACGGQPTIGGMFCHLDEGVLQGIVMVRHDVDVVSKERVCTSDGTESCHFEIQCKNNGIEPSI